jgi:mannan endo-1,4-beta-mannosidase
MPEMYRAVKKITGTRIPITYHECGTPPNPDSCFSKGAMWSWWMEWHTEHLRKVDKKYLKYVYNHDLIITKDEVPDIMSRYGKK